MPRAIVFLCLFLAAIVFMPMLAPYDPMRTDTTRQLEAPNADHILGTDLLGRDVLSRAFYGGQHTLLIAGLATGIAVVPGVLLGLFGTLGWADQILKVVINALLAFPGLLLALIVMTLLGQGALQLALATGLVQLAPCVRVMHAAVLAELGQGYTEAARSLGANVSWIGLKHVLPNTLPTVLAYGGVVFAYAILNSAALSFLGLGGEPGVPDWGVMLAEGRQVFRTAPWVAAAPGFAITLSVVLVNWATRQRRKP